MVSKLSQIVEGWGAYFFKNEEHEELAKKRATICSKCPKIEKSKIIAVFMKDSKFKNIQGYKCGICECPLSTKTRSLSSDCPLGKW